jgi:hypothetical protein
LIENGSASWTTVQVWEASMDNIMHTILIPSEPTSSSNRFDWGWAAIAAAVFGEGSFKAGVPFKEAMGLSVTCER